MQRTLPADPYDASRNDGPNPRGSSSPLFDTKRLPKIESWTIYAANRLISLQMISIFLNHAFSSTWLLAFHDPATPPI